jgi:hypothetical protein
MALSFEDKLQINELISRMYFALDSKDSEIYSSTFTDDGVLTHPYYGGSKGNAPIKTWLDTHFAGPHSGHARHFLTNQVIDGDSAGAHFRCYVISLDVSVNPPGISSGHLDIRLVRSKDGWRIQNKVVSIDHGNAH